MGKEHAALYGVADASAQLGDIRAADVFAAHINLAARWLDQTVYHFQKGRFAAAGGADDRYELSLRDGKAEILNDYPVAIGHTDIFVFDRVHGISFSAGLRHEPHLLQECRGHLLRRYALGLYLIIHFRHLRVRD